jgi:hypothetical protein
LFDGDELLTNKIVGAKLCVKGNRRINSTNGDGECHSLQSAVWVASLDKNGSEAPLFFLALLAASYNAYYPG